MNGTVGSPIPFIQLKDDQFVINEEARDFLHQFEDCVGVLAIVGKYRTGKSLFLNKVILNNTNLFKVSPTINSCTKGLWLSKKTIVSEHPDTPDMNILVIDTEGFGAMEETSNYNNKIILLALLLSSYFIYNSVGSIDEKSLNSLNMITNLAKDLQTKNMNSDKLEDQFPSFLWVIRDFTLKLVDADGQPIDSRGYLENALQIQKKVSDTIEQKNKIRRMIKHFFKDRDCSTLVRPVETEEQLQTLTELDDSNFRPEFVDQITNLRQRILKKVKPKKLKGKNLNGWMLLQLAELYIQVINSGSLPNLEGSWKHLINYEMEKIVKDVLKNVQQKICELSNQIFTKKQIVSLQEKINQESLIILKQRITFQKQFSSAAEKVKKQIKILVQKFYQANREKSKNFLYQQFKNDNCPFQKFMRVEELDNFLSKLEKKYLSNFSEHPYFEEFLIGKLLPFKYENVIHYCKMTEEERESTKKMIELKSEDYKMKEGQMINQLSENRNRINYLENELKMVQIKLQSEERQKRMQKQQLTNEIKALKADLFQEKQKNQVLQKLNSKLDSQVNQKGQELQKIQSQNSYMVNDLKYGEKEIQILKNAIGFKDKQIESLKKTVSELNHSIDNQIQKQKLILIKNKSQFQTKTAEYNSLQSKYEKSRNEIIEIHRLYSQTEAELQKKEAIWIKETQFLQNTIEQMKNYLKIENQKSQQFIEINKNLASALKCMEERFHQAEKKEQQLKEYKRCVKNSSCLQCQNCTKFFVPTIFPQHLNICMAIPHEVKEEYQNMTEEPEKISISISQTLLKDSNEKPYTQYSIELQKNEKKWTINRKYKSFCQLHSNLRILLPGVSLSESSYIVNPQQGAKKSLLIEERRVLLEKYLNDLGKNSLVTRSSIWKDFIDEPEDYQSSQVYHIPSKKSSPYKQNTNISQEMRPPQKSPEEFLKIWNERNQRQKEISYQKYKKLK